MRTTTPAQRTARLFWGVMGSSLLVVTGAVLVWLLGSRLESSIHVFESCWMMMRQIWGAPIEYNESFSFVGWLALLLAASGVWAAGQGLAAWRRTRRLWARSEPYCCGRCPVLDTAVAALPDVRQRLRTLPTLNAMACTVGLWRPQIMLSAGLVADLSTAELRAVLGHEWGHVRRHDPLRLALLRFCCHALWFLPIIRILVRDTARSMEEAADDMAVAMTEQPLDLAAALVKTAKAQASSRWSPTPALGGELAVTERIERLLNVSPARPPRRPYWAWVVSVVVVGGLFVLSILPGHAAVVAALTRSTARQPSMLGCPMDLPRGNRA